MRDGSGSYAGRGGEARGGGIGLGGVTRGIDMDCW